MARRHKKSVHGGAKKKFPTWAKWGLGLGAAAGVAYIFWPKTASAATGPTLPAKPGTPPGPIAPVKGEVIIQAGSHVPLTAALRAVVSQEGKTVLTISNPEYVSVPAGTVIAISKLDPDGTIYFQYAGRLLSSPVEDYTASV